MQDQDKTKEQLINELNELRLKMAECHNYEAAQADITERKNEENVLKQSEERYRSLFQNMLEGLAVCKMIYDVNGRPICCELWPGNTADVKSLIPVVDRLRSRFSIGTVCMVADRGMISKDTIVELDSRCWPYILGARMRNQKEVRDEVLSRGGRYQVVPAASFGLWACLFHLQCAQCDGGTPMNSP